MIEKKAVSEGSNVYSITIKKLTVKEYVKSHWLLIVSLIAILIISLTVFAIVFWDRLNDVGAWGSVIAGIFTYLGSSFLGLVVFYNTLSQQREREIEDQIMVEINYYLDPDKRMDTGFFVPSTDDEINKEQFTSHHTKYHKSLDECDPNQMRYLYYEVTNRNTHVPIYVEPVSIYVLSGKKLVDAEYYSYYSDTNDNDAIDYKQKKRCYIGTNKKLLKDDYFLSDNFQLCYVAIRISSIKGQVLYASFEYFMGSTLGKARPKFATEEEFKERVAKLHAPVYSMMYLKQTLDGQGARAK